MKPRQAGATAKFQIADFRSGKSVHRVAPVRASPPRLRAETTLMQPKLKHLSIVLLACTLILCFRGATQAAERSAKPPALLLANELGPQADPAKYLVSEKYDGVRAMWDGKVLRFRSGRAVNAPPWF